MDRLLRLSLILHELGSVKGEKNLQKLIYLIQSHGESIGYKFKWNLFGPISFNLQYDLEEAIAMGFIKINRNENVPVYTSTITAQDSIYWNKRINNLNLSEDVVLNISSISKLLDYSSKYPNHIEIAASLDYLTKEDGLTIEDAKTTLIKKSGQRFSNNDIDISAKLIENLN